MNTDSSSVIILESKDNADVAKTEFSQFEDLSTKGYCRIVKAWQGGRWWVLKGLKEEYHSQSIYKNLLQKEYEITSALNHPGIVRVFGLEVVEGLGRCILMEWIDGITLGEWLRLNPSKQLRREVFLQLLDAVEYIHSRQIVHRDIKPSNILITRNGNNVKLIDFGLSDTDSYTVFKQPSGTIGYISPEQTEENLTDQRNDIYSLGCVLEDLSLGGKYAHIISRCKDKLENRYYNVVKLRKAIQTITRIPYIIMWCLLSICFVAVVVMAASRTNFTEESNIIIKDNDCFSTGDIQYKIISVADRTVEVVDTHSKEIDDVFLPDSVYYNRQWFYIKGLYDYAFFDCPIKSMRLPASLKYIRIGSFYNNRFKTIEIPDSVETLGRGMFVGCSELKSVVFGSGMKNIEMHAFTDFPSLRKITVKAKQPPTIVLMQVDDYDSLTLFVPEESIGLYRKADEWSRIKNIQPIR